MKRLFTLITISSIIAFPSFGQEEKMKKLENLESKTVTEAQTEVKSEARAESESKVETTAKQDTVIVEVGDEIFSVKEMGDETRIKIGKKQFRVVENNDGVVVFKSYNKEDNNNESNSNRHDRFRGHLGGLEVGFNSYLTDFWSTTLAPEDYYMDLSTANSVNWNFLLPCINIGFARHFGLVATLGMSFNKYRFDGNNSIVKDENGIIGPYYPEDGIVYSKTKLSTTYATLPVMLEGQIPVSGSHNRTINIGAGVIGAVKLGSHTKMVYHTDGKQKEKYKDDYSLNTLRWGATARVGYEFFQVYGTCYFTELFEAGKGPELYPFEVGVAFTIND
jgi:hypothetical protein